MKMAQIKFDIIRRANGGTQQTMSYVLGSFRACCTQEEVTVAATSNIKTGHSRLPSNLTHNRVEILYCGNLLG